MDCREWLDIKQYEFLMNYFMRRQRELGLAELNEPYSYDGFSLYDQLYQQVVKEAEVAYIECFGEPAPPIAFTNLFHLAELELAGKRPRLKSPKALQ
ncbi:hypothetical protein GCM10010919_21620 [Alishewanella longhuensis]|uniref:Uncharacterized protein n=1 Tax=Alishewanella longhuensis TaxID=1091037 RepID=A0ABQ3KYU9_9ALTE|nr:hypothetical protein [Alishewanella longhuensis]GHG70818.1 hypothetical protein GCM10010919_21620 [Alishewanella longhuensis]